MKKPKPASGMPKVLRDAFDERDAYIESIKPINGAGIMVSESPVGRPINAAPSGTASSDGLQNIDLDVCHMGTAAKRTFRCSEILPP